MGLVQAIVWKFSPRCSGTAEEGQAEGQRQGKRREQEGRGEGS